MSTGNRLPIAMIRSTSMPASENFSWFPYRYQVPFVLNNIKIVPTCIMHMHRSHLPVPGISLPGYRYRTQFKSITTGYRDSPILTVRVLHSFPSYR